MNREEAIKVLQNEVACSNKDGCSLRCDLCKLYVSDNQAIDAYDMAISALRQQETVTNRNGLNEPITMDELRKMEGQPVYIVENTEYWAIVNSFDQAGVYLLSYGNPDDYGYFGLYGKTWLAYRQKPEEGTV